jgi:phosphatidate cytidylyltransferase
VTESQLQAAGSGETASSGDASAAPKQKGGGFARRVASGVTLGLFSAAIVTYGNLAFLLAVILITVQATQEYYGFITSKGIAAGMRPPPRLVSVTTTIMCTSIALLAYFYKGRSGTVLAVTSFALLVLQVVATKRPKFAQLASSLFGLFYCGERAWGGV